MSREIQNEVEQARHRAIARHHRELAERLGSAGYYALAASHLLEAKLEELDALAVAAERSAY